MNFAALEIIEELVRSETAVDAGMTVLVDFCERTHASSTWPKLRALNFTEDKIALEVWIRQLLSTEPPHNDINGFWFGLFNAILDNDKATSCFYLAGSTRFDSNDRDGIWACDPEYFPQGRYSSSPVLNAIYKIGFDDSNDIGELAEFALCLGYSCLVVAEWCQGPIKRELLGSAPSRGIVVGFDGGASVFISLLTPGPD